MLHYLVKFKICFQARVQFRSLVSVMQFKRTRIGHGLIVEVYVARD